MHAQIIAGIIEERGIEKVFAGKPGVAHLLSFIIRTGNTFLGSLLWVRHLCASTLIKYTVRQGFALAIPCASCMWERAVALPSTQMRSG